MFRKKNNIRSLACTRTSIPVLLFALTGLTACEAAESTGEEPSEEIGTAELPVAGNAGTPVSFESLREDQGKYREVVLVRFTDPCGGDPTQSCNYVCTGTIVAPHAVLTANHCIGSNMTVGWNGRSLAVNARHLNPYVTSPYYPEWWSDLDAARNDGRTDDWPAQHDQAILFVAGLTPELLAEEHIRPADIQADADTDQFTIVGAGSTPNVAWRAFLPSQFVQAKVNDIFSDPRDGYLTRNGTTYGFGTATGGDSGGPTIGSRTFPWLNGALDVDRHVVGTAQNQIDLAPLSYNPGITMTAHQRYTVRFNSLWVDARRDDPDNDGLPAACDPHPTSVDPSSASLCPSMIGGPTGNARRPTGLMQCRPGYAAVGIHGRAGWQIDRLGVTCRSLSCLVRGDASCADEYRTEAFGGDGGSAFDLKCSSGVMSGVSGRHTTSSTLYSVQPTCVPVENITGDPQLPMSWQLATVGADNGTRTDGSPYSRACAAHQALLGFQARSTDAFIVDGLTPICSGDLRSYSPFVGGPGGGAHDLRCGAGEVTVGTIQMAVDRNSDPAVTTMTVGPFGLLCAPRARVEAGQAPADSEITVLHGSYHDPNFNLDLPATTQRLSEATFAGGTQRSSCPAGYALDGVTVRSGALVDRVSSLRCHDIRPGGNDIDSIPVNVGGWGGSPRLAYCGTGQIADGIFLRSGASTDGFALHCRSN